MQAQQFGVQDVRVEAVPSKDMGRFLLPTLGVVAAAILAGLVLPGLFERADHDVGM